MSIGKKILLVYPSSLFPIKMMSQKHTFNLIKVLNQSHHLDVVTFVKTESELLKNKNELRGYCTNYFPMFDGRRKYTKIIKFAINSFYSFISGIPNQYYYINSSNVHRFLLEKVNNEKYDIVHIEFWQLGDFFNRLPKEIYKVINTHGLQYLEYELSRASIRIIEAIKKKELKVLCDSDLVITPNELSSIGISEVITKNINHFRMKVGFDLKDMLSFGYHPRGKTIVFYGNLQSKQNVQAFFRLYRNILPKIRFQVRDVKLIVVGANPTKEIQELHDNKSVLIYGYVEDIKPVLCSATLAIIPLEIGVGFRGRVIELMALGVPVIGTHNALDSIELENGKDGFIADSNDELIEIAVNLITDQELHNKISVNGREFVKNNYTFDQTFKQLSIHYSELS
ncbi:MAG: glycosyltransferase family 4 protein [Melioribacteraceae bacterium]|nr:glycosyltransferase family 4 protein [Melioribacteraceae bacterium]